MKRQRNTAQMKEQHKTPEKELHKMEISNLSDAEFKILIISHYVFQQHKKKTQQK